MARSVVRLFRPTRKEIPATGWQLTFFGFLSGFGLKQTYLLKTQEVTLYAVSYSALLKNDSNFLKHLPMCFFMQRMNLFFLETRQPCTEYLSDFIVVHHSGNTDIHA